MELTRWSPFGLASLRREMDDLFDAFLGRAPNALSNGGWTPWLDMAETPEELVVKAELPGINEKDISVTVSGGQLVIKGERKAEEETKDKHIHRLERRFGSFERAVLLPVAVDEDKTVAEYKNGVLEVRLPKTVKERPKQVTVKIK